jgi:hypothetical protein
MNGNVRQLIRREYNDDENGAVALVQGWLEAYLDHVDNDWVYYSFSDIAEESYEFLQRYDNDL